MKLAIGLDIGHSAPKIVWATTLNPSQHTLDLFPTVVIPAINLTDEATRQRAMKETVTLRGRSYFYGETALKQGRVSDFSGQERDWIFSDLHDVLVIGAFKRVLDAVKQSHRDPVHIELVMGLPAAWYANHRDQLKDRISNLLAGLLHMGQSLNVRIQSQPFGTLQEMIFAADGRISKEHDLDNENWGIIEIGQYTTDTILIMGSDQIQAGTGSCAGTNVAFERMTAGLQEHNLPVDLKTVETAITTGLITNYGKKINVQELRKQATAHLASIVADEAKRRFNDYAAHLNGVVVAGGGASLVYPAIAELYPHARMAANPRFSVAEGFCRFGLFKIANP